MPESNPDRKESPLSKDTEKAVVEGVEICNCTNEQLERGETFGLAICPNAADGDAPLPARHPRLDSEGEPFPTEEGRVDDRALDPREAHRDFDRGAFTWIGSEHLGGGIFCASIYSDAAADSPYLWITQGEDGPQKFLACVYVGGADGEEAEPRSSERSAALMILRLSRYMLPQQKDRINKATGSMPGRRPGTPGPAARWPFATTTVSTTPRGPDQRGRRVPDWRLHR